MEHTTIGMIGPGEWISAVGKETSDTSFAVRAIKKDDHIVTVLSPSRYPEKIWSLLFTLSLSDTVLMNIEKIDRNLGETIIALDLMKKRKGAYHVSEMVDMTGFESLIRDTVMEDWRDLDPEPAVLREDIFGMTKEKPEGEPVVVVDQSFPVKGVGTVVLGFVVSGCVRRHHQLITCPGGKRTQVRSIQIHDRDHEVAPAGARVGLAMKNIDPEDIPRGTALVEEGYGIEQHDRIEASFRVSPFWKDPVEEGTRLHLGSSLQFLPATIEKIIDTREENGNRIVDARIVPESPVWAGPDSLFTLVFLDSKSFRVFAAGEII